MNAPLTAKDFATDQEVRWCPGCGDYAILKCVQKTMADIEAKPDETVFVSGIGCSSRFPYYMSTYGFHTIHGRAPAFATGLKLANPDLDVWMVTGDGDGLSIGGNHLLHLLRRNVNMQVLLFNNEIYGLTKGQYSPTSRPGTRSPSSPKGSIETSISAGAFALGAGARFIARGIDTDIKHLSETLKSAHRYNGTAFVEIYQNCIVYNADVFKGFTEKSVAADNQLHVEHGKPLVFAKETKGLIFNPKTMKLEVATIRENGDGKNGVSIEDILVHDSKNKAIAQMLIDMPESDFPIALGVLYENPADASFDQHFWRNHPTGGKRTGKVADLLRQGSIWQK